MRLKALGLAMATSLLLVLLFVGAIASAQDPTPPPPPPPSDGGMTITQTLSDGAQRNTIAFDGLAFLTDNLGADSFFPPSKVADFWGFQSLRDNDPTGMGTTPNFFDQSFPEHVADFDASAASEIDRVGGKPGGTHSSPRPTAGRSRCNVSSDAGRPSRSHCPAPRSSACDQRTRDLIFSMRWSKTIPRRS
jgi:hypothetical protein